MINRFSSLNQIAEYLRKRGENLKPLDEFQIRKIEIEFNAPLPATYRTFLSLMGNGAGNYMRGSSVFFNEIFSLRKWTMELINENGLNPLPKNAFVFWMHQGYQSAYFRLNESNDPPVFYYEEGNRTQDFQLKEKKLTDFFVAQLLSSYPDLN